MGFFFFTVAWECGRGDDLPAACSPAPPPQAALPTPLHPRRGWASVGRPCLPAPRWAPSSARACERAGRGLTMASSASSSFIRLSLRSSCERSAVAWSVASLAWRRSSHFSRSSRSFSLARALTASSLSCRGRARGVKKRGVGLLMAWRYLEGP